MRAGQFIIDPDTGGPVHPFPWLLGIGGLAHAAVERVVSVGWTGDNTNSRDINMGVECDFVLVVYNGNAPGNQDHMDLALSLRAVHSIFVELTGSGTWHYAGSNGDAYWQGIQIGTNNIRLGSTGAHVRGTNVVGANFTAYGFKFRNFP